MNNKCIVSSAGGLLRVAAVAGGDVAVHVVGLAARAAARRRGGRRAGAGRQRRHAPGARRGARHALPAHAAAGQAAAHLPSQQQAHHGEPSYSYVIDVLQYHANLSTTDSTMHTV